ncbi:MAG: zinc transporter ZupT [Bacteroidales bacterium]|nr:zinc transporter ZupT [Bacteroidales bacterium]MCL2738134.1 zinc transporter ZupT [Bacteroidales bacterium]
MIAGLATGIGSLIALIAKRTNTKFLCVSLGFSAGVMLYVSFMDLIPMAKEEFTSQLGDKAGMLGLLLAFFGGMGIIMLIDFLIPKTNNPHEFQDVDELKKLDGQRKSLHRVGIVVALSLVAHNFPEGIAVFTTTMSGGLMVAIPITIAIAIHNIPEGIAVSVPIYYATGNKRKAFWLSFLSGLAEPLGALAAYFFLMPFWSPFVHGIVMAAVAGIMVFISLDELLPTAEKYGEHHLSISGLIAGMMVMALSLFLFM